MPGAGCRVPGAVRRAGASVLSAVLVPCVPGAERAPGGGADARSAADARAGDSGGGVAGRQRHGSRRARIGGQQPAGRAGGAARRRRRPARDDRRRWPRAVCVGAAWRPRARQRRRRRRAARVARRSTCRPPAACARFWWRASGLGTGGGAPMRRRHRRLGDVGAGGALSFGNNTRFAIEFQDDTIAVFYLLEIVNSSGAPVTPASPLVINLPAEAVGASLLEGASPLAVVNGPRVSIAGPLPVGVTPVPIAFRVESWGARHELRAGVPAGARSGRRGRAAAGRPHRREPAGVERAGGVAQRPGVLHRHRARPAGGHAAAIDAGGTAAQEPAAALHGARAGRDRGRRRRLAGDDARHGKRRQPSASRGATRARPGGAGGA